jgi:hypothetical protein
VRPYEPIVVDRLDDIQFAHRGITLGLGPATFLEDASVSHRIALRRLDTLVEGLRQLRLCEVQAADGQGSNGNAADGRQHERVLDLGLDARGDGSQGESGAAPFRLLGCAWQKVDFDHRCG